MAVTIDATVAGVSSNSYATQTEVNNYFAARLPLAPPWEDADDPTAAMAMATRLLGMIGQSRTILKMNPDGTYYYITTRGWTGAPTTTTQRLAWPRTGMYDGNGNAIGSMTIPQELKDAEAELAGQLVVTDTTLDNQVLIQGITSVKAGSVAVTFKDMIEKHILPDAVWLLMPASWFTDEIYTPAMPAEFDVVSE